MLDLQLSNKSLPAVSNYLTKLQIKQINEYKLNMKKKSKLENNHVTGTGLKMQVECIVVTLSNNLCKLNNCRGLDILPHSVNIWNFQHVKISHHHQMTKISFLLFFKYCFEKIPQDFLMVEILDTE